MLLSAIPASLPSPMPVVRSTPFAEATLAARLGTERALAALGVDSSLALAQASEAAALLERATGFPHPAEAEPLVSQALTLLRVGVRQLGVDLPDSQAAARMHWNNALERFASIEQLLATR